MAATTADLRDKINTSLHAVEVMEAAYPNLRGAVKSLFELIVTLEKNNLSIMIDILDLMEAKEAR